MHAYVSQLVSRGAILTVFPHDVLNPAFGFCATLEGPYGRIRGSGITPQDAIADLGRLLDSGEVLPVA